MPLFSYDGSWKGFLTVLNRADMFSSGELESIRLRRRNSSGGLGFDDGEFVAAVERDARKVHGTLAERLGSRGAWVMSRAQAAGRDDVDMLLLRLWTAPERLAREERILIREWADRVALEVHRYQGILRLVPLDGGLMYAPLRPRYSILSFVGGWISGRFPDTPLLLHDHGRKLFRWYRLGGREGAGASGGSGEGPWRDLKKRLPALPSEEELLRIAGTGDAVEECWSGYVKSASIRERKNSTLQRSYLPLKYREFLPETRT
jgi:probable DNA metabolism protein